MLTHGSLFTGIGGFDLGFERAGIKTIWQVENNPYAIRVLEKHWPNVKRYKDIKTVNWSKVETPDIITGGFPCQPVSVAGKRKVQDDERWLWPEYARCLRVLRPRYIVVENVPGLLIRGFGDVLGDLAALGYDAEWDCIPAAAFGAPHLRYRVWVVAYANIPRLQRRDSERLQKCSREQFIGQGSSRLADAGQGGRQGWAEMFGQGRRGEFTNGDWWRVEPDVGRVANGVSSRVDRLRCLGNAVVPQITEWLARRIIDYDTERNNNG